MMSPKIAIFVSTLKIGGAEKQRIFLFNALKYKYETFLIIFYGDIVEGQNLKLIKDGHGKVIALRGNLTRKILYLYKFFKAERITHLFTYLTKPNFYGAIIGRLAGVRFVYPGIRSTVLPAWKIFLEKIASFFSTAVILNSYAGEYIIKQRGFKRTCVIPNCLDNISAPIQKKEKSPIVIISVGRFVEEKDYSTSLNAIGELLKVSNNFIYRLVGYGPLEAQLRKKVIELQLSNNVEIIIKPDNIPQLLNDADIYLSTSLFEGTSNAIMEAMNACLPIVATDVGDNNRLILEGINGFLHGVGDYKGIAKSLEALMLNYDKRIDWGLESNRILNENYSYDIFKTKYLNLIEQA